MKKLIYGLLVTGLLVSCGRNSSGGGNGQTISDLEVRRARVVCSRQAYANRCSRVRETNQALTFGELYGPYCQRRYNACVRQMTGRL